MQDSKDHLVLRHKKIGDEAVTLYQITYMTYVTAQSWAEPSQDTLRHNSCRPTSLAIFVSSFHKAPLHTFTPWLISSDHITSPSATPWPG